MYATAAATHAEAAFPPLDHNKNQAPTPTLSQLAAPHKGFQILDASSLTFTNMGTKRWAENRPTESYRAKPRAIPFGAKLSNLAYRTL